jgi:hypothetical protein
MKEVVIFGAGSSYGARIPRPPLGASLHHYILKYLDAKRRVDSPFPDCVGRDIEKVTQKLNAAMSYETAVKILLQEHWEKNRSNNKVTEAYDILKAMNRYMAYALTPPLGDDPRVDDAFVEGVDEYDRFLKRRYPCVESLSDVIFITLNYDCLLERAICRTYFPNQNDGKQCLCTHVDYHIENGKQGVVKVLKPHGSINWVASMGDGRLGQHPIPIDRLSIQSYGLPSWDTGTIRVVDSPTDAGYEDLVVAFYAPRKPIQANRSQLEDVREYARDCVEMADRVEIIGVHFPGDESDDPFLSDLFTILKQRVGEATILYVNPNQSEADQARRCGFEPCVQHFDEYNRLVEEGVDE